MKPLHFFLSHIFVILIVNIVVDAHVLPERPIDNLNEDYYESESLKTIENAKHVEAEIANSGVDDVQNHDSENAIKDENESERTGEEEEGPFLLAESESANALPDEEEEGNDLEHKKLSLGKGGRGKGGKGGNGGKGRPGGKGGKGGQGGGGRGGRGTGGGGGGRGGQGGKGGRGGGGKGGQGGRGGGRGGNGGGGGRGGGQGGGRGGRGGGGGGDGKRCGIFGCQDKNPCPEGKKKCGGFDMGGIGGHIGDILVGSGGSNYDYPDRGEYYDDNRRGDYGSSGGNGGDYGNGGSDGGDFGGFNDDIFDIGKDMDIHIDI